MAFRWHPGEPPPKIEAHSNAKLTVLRNYLRAYFDRLNVNPGREEFKIDLVDGFAGGGTFIDGAETVSGTPLIMLEEAAAAATRLNRNRTKPLRFDYKCYFIDMNKHHADCLRNTLGERGYAKNDNVVIENKKFEDAVVGVVAEIRRRQPRAGRAIFLLDQTGFAQVALALVGRIFRELPSAEVILTFAVDAMVNHLSRRPDLVKAVAPLDLTDPQVRDLIEMRDGDGGRALVQRTLRGHIRAITGATFDTPFFIRPRGSRRALWFLHLSRHPTARDVMIRLHWDFQNTFQHYGRGDFGMLGWDALRPDALPLFHFEEDQAKQMRDQLAGSMPRELFALASDVPITLDTVRFEFANRTAARFSDLDEVMLQLFKEREIDVLDHEGRLRSRSLTRLRPTDRIGLPDTLLLPGLSRKR